MSRQNLGPFRIRPRGIYNSSANYRFLDLVTYNGSSYLCINYDTIDGTAVTGVLPYGEVGSDIYWQCIAHKGDKGDTGDFYSEYLIITDGYWDYSVSDKIIVPEYSNTTLTIDNVYDGCCGIILSKYDLELPYNSDYSLDYNYLNIGRYDSNKYYMYSFIYGLDYLNFSNQIPQYKFVWNRSIISTEGGNNGGGGGGLPEPWED